VTRLVSGTRQITIDGKDYHLIDEQHFQPSRIKSGKYELTLSRQVVVTPDGSSNYPTCGKGPTLTIPPGQYAILYAQEKIAIPNYAIGFISIKFGNTYRGLVNISGFHVDPGFAGHLKFSVYNAGNHPIFLDYGSECFQIWFADLDRPTADTYKGNHENQERVTPEDRAQLSDRRHSPTALSERIESIESKINAVYAVGIVVLLPLLIGLAVAIFNHWIGAKNKLGIEGELFAVAELIFILCLIMGFFGAIFFFCYKRNELAIKRFFRRLKENMKK